MKNRKYLPYIEQVKAMGCTVEQGSKHAKIKSPMGKLLTVWQTNGGTDLQPQCMARAVRRVAQALEAERQHSKKPTPV